MSDFFFSFPSLFCLKGYESKFAIAKVYAFLLTDLLLERLFNVKVALLFSSLFFNSKERSQRLSVRQTASST